MSEFFYVSSNCHHDTSITAGMGLLMAFENGHWSLFEFPNYLHTGSIVNLGILM